jgi:hypothetical protein
MPSDWTNKIGEDLSVRVKSSAPDSFSQPVEPRLLTRKTYEMQMFHMSSLKMGLDRVVLNGFENGSSGDVSFDLMRRLSVAHQIHYESQGNLSKDEIERLLRHGAYEIFNEDKTGEGEKASNEFMEQDIASILERRSRVVVHDNTGSGSSAAGGTFSRASFKAKSQDPHSNDEVDVDDPDFWKKFLAHVPEEDDEEEQLQGRRQRNQQKNYSERTHQENLERHLQNDENEDDASVESVALEIDGIRLAWGGSTDCDWRRTDVEAVGKFLCTFGYCDGLAADRLRSLVLKEKHSDNEVSSTLIENQR